MLEELNLTYDILIYPRHLPVATELVVAVPAPAVRPRSSGEAGDSDGRDSGQWERHIRELAESRNVCCKVSGLVTEADWTDGRAIRFRPYLDVAFDCFGADRLLAGSDWPVCTVAADYGRTMSLIDRLSGTRARASERDAVMGGNAVRFWGLPAGELV